MVSIEQTKKWYSQLIQSYSQPKFPDWLVDIQQKYQKIFSHKGFPNRKNKLWKYVDLTQLINTKFTMMNCEHSYVPLIESTEIKIVFVNGKYMPHLSDLNSLPDNVVVCDIATAANKYSDYVKPLLSKEIDVSMYPFACLNTALINDGIFLFIPGNTIIKKTIRIISVCTHSEINFFSNLRNIIILGKQARANIYESVCNANSNVMSVDNQLTQILLYDNAKLDYYKLQAINPLSFHFANLYIKQFSNSNLDTYHACLGGYFARENINVDLQQDNACFKASGLYYLKNKKQDINYNLHVDHYASSCKSNIYYKGVLDGKTRATFDAKIKAHNNAQGTNARVVNRNILLSDECEVNSKPELEIYTDNIKCSHGVTIGQLDNEMLFYLRSRGINEIEAKHLLLRAFIDEIVNKIKLPCMVDYLNKFLEIGV